MKKEKRNKSFMTKNKIVFWVKKPENIALIFLLIIVTIIGIIDDKLDIILIVYVVAFLFGLLIGTIFYLKDKFF